MSDGIGKPADSGGTALPLKGRVGVGLQVLGAALWLFGVAWQMLLAGNAILVRFGYWDPHVMLGRMLFLPALMILIGGILSRRGLKVGVLLLVLYLVQSALIQLPDSLAALKGLHAMNALLLFAVGGWVAWLALRQKPA